MNETNEGVRTSLLILYLYLSGEYLVDRSIALISVLFREHFVAVLKKCELFIKQTS
jgi:hypothetical protein